MPQFSHGIHRMGQVHGGDPANRPGWLATIAATASLEMSGPFGPHQAHSIPVRTPAASIAATVASTGTSPPASCPCAQRRRESNIGSARNSADGCCIQASMIMLQPSGSRSGTRQPVSRFNP